MNSQTSETPTDTHPPQDQMATPEASEVTAGPGPDDAAAPGEQDSNPRDEVEKWRDLALRGQAELDNFRKRMAREKLDAIKFGNSALLESLLPIIDNFRFGLDAARQEPGSSVVFQGMSMVMKQLADFLADHGVTEYGEAGDSFDPNLHEAVQLEHSDTVEEGRIVAVLRRGYRLHDRLLRAANVVVSKGPDSSEPQGETSAGMP